MRAKILAILASAILPLLAWLQAGNGQPAFGQGKGSKNQGPPDLEKEIFRELREAYKAPYEVHQDVLKELRRNYEQPSEKREATIFRELNRLYVMTAERERVILREIRKAYDRQSVDQEERVFAEIAKAERLPEGAVPSSVQSQQAWKVFSRLDLNEDGRLSPDEMPEPLRSQRNRWDTNRDGVIDADEYWAYYQNRLSSMSDQVAAGLIDLGLKRGGPSRIIVIPEEEMSRPVVNRAGKLPNGLPAWFAQLDFDKDGQVALFEWRRGGKPLQDFAAIDRNNDGFITAEEALRHAALNPETTAVASADRAMTGPGDKQNQGEKIGKMLKLSKKGPKK